MSARLRIIDPGLQATVQDFGRPGVLGLGVPVAGVLDLPAMRLANALAGNHEAAAVIELRLTGITFRVEGRALRIAVTGAQSRITVELSDGERRVFPAWRTVPVPEGALLIVAAPEGSATATLAVSGGIDVALLWGSRATFLRGGFGGFEGRALRRGDVVAVGEPADAPLLAAQPPPKAEAPARLRVTLGPQADYFTHEALAAFAAEPFTVTREADRMGIRLAGPELGHRRGHDIVSDAVLPGSIQVPGSMQPILLLADCQTTGGYPKIATVISADLPVAARLRPGDSVRFEPVCVVAAEAAARAAERALRDIIADLAPVREAATLDLAALYRENLISGVVGGKD